MPEILTDKASLLCDKGMTPSSLKVTSHGFYKADDKLIATEQDKHAEINIPGFGICLITKIKCTPIIIKWQNAAKNVCINEHKILTEKSTCSCSIGGKISAINKGHCEKHEVE